FKEFLVKALIEDSKLFLLSESLAAYLINIRLGKVEYSIPIKNLETWDEENVPIEGRVSNSKKTHQLIKMAVKHEYFTKEVPDLNSARGRNMMAQQVKHLAALLDYTFKYTL